MSRGNSKPTILHYGKVIYQRSKDDNGHDCVCCEGKHVFAVYPDFGNHPTEHTLNYSGHRKLDIRNDLLYNFLLKHRDIAEGMILAVSFSLIDDVPLKEDKDNG